MEEFPIKLPLKYQFKFLMMYLALSEVTFTLNVKLFCSSDCIGDTLRTGINKSEIIIINNQIILLLLSYLTSSFNNDATNTQNVITDVNSAKVACFIVCHMNSQCHIGTEARGAPTSIVSSPPIPQLYWSVY